MIINWIIIFQQGILTRVYPYIHASLRILKLHYMYVYVYFTLHVLHAAVKGTYEKDYLFSLNSSTYETCVKYIRM